jgi:hypothetical protein
MMEPTPNFARNFNDTITEAIYSAIERIQGQGQEQEQFSESTKQFFANSARSFIESQQVLFKQRINLHNILKIKLAFINSVRMSFPDMVISEVREQLSLGENDKTPQNLQEEINHLIDQEFELAATDEEFLDIMLYDELSENEKRTEFEAMKDELELTPKLLEMAQSNTGTMLDVALIQPEVLFL